MKTEAEDDLTPRDYFKAGFVVGMFTWLIVAIIADLIFS